MKEGSGFTHKEQAGLPCKGLHARLSKNLLGETILSYSIRGSPTLNPKPYTLDLKLLAPR